MGVTADAAAILSCRLINTRTTLLISSMSLLSRRKAADTGAVKKCTGKNAPDKIVKVPVGTMIYQLRNVDGGGRIEDEQPDDAIPDLEGSIDGSEISEQPRGSTEEHSRIRAPRRSHRDGQEFLLCKGGAGGKGNVHFKSSRNRAPREYTEGGEGEGGHFLSSCVLSQTQRWSVIPTPGNQH